MPKKHTGLRIWTPLPGLRQHPPLSGASVDKRNERASYVSGAAYNGLRASCVIVGPESSFEKAREKSLRKRCCRSFIAKLFVVTDEPLARQINPLAFVFDGPADDGGAPAVPLEDRQGGIGVFL